VEPPSLCTNRRTGRKVGLWRRTRVAQAGTSSRVLYSRGSRSTNGKRQSCGGFAWDRIRMSVCVDAINYKGGCGGDVALRKITLDA